MELNNNAKNHLKLLLSIVRSDNRIVSFSELEKQYTLFENLIEMGFNQGYEQGYFAGAGATAEIAYKMSLQSVIDDK